jgi:hypothetical protein
LLLRLVFNGILEGSPLDEPIWIFPDDTKPRLFFFGGLEPIYKEIGLAKVVQRMRNQGRRR